MAEFDVQLSQTSSRSWQVSNGKSDVRRSFRHRGHALAYARAIAHSHQSDLYIKGPDGKTIRQSRLSLTYPTVLE